MEQMSQQATRSLVLAELEARDTRFEDIDNKQTLVRNALNKVLGQSVKGDSDNNQRRVGGLGRGPGGSDVILPEGMDQREFNIRSNDIVNNSTGGILEELSVNGSPPLNEDGEEITPDDLKKGANNITGNFQFVTAAPGVYFLSFNDGRLAQTRGGELYKLNMNQLVGEPLPPAPESAPFREEERAIGSRGQGIQRRESQQSDLDRAIQNRQPPEGAQ